MNFRYFYGTYHGQYYVCLCRQMSVYLQWSIVSAVALNETKPI